MDSINSTGGRMAGAPAGTTEGGLNGMTSKVRGVFGGTIRRAGIAVCVAGLGVVTYGVLTPEHGALAAAPTGGGCSAPSASSVTGVFKSISTHVVGSSTQGTSCGTDSATQADYPITGWVADNPGAGVTVQLGDFYEGLSAHKFYWGAYAMSLGSCTDGSATAGSYNVPQSNGGSYPNSMPSFTGTLATVTGGADGKVICAYSLTVQNAPTVSGTGSDKLNSSRNDLWIALNNSATSHHTATNSVKPPTLGSGGSSTSSTTSSTTSTTSSTTTTTTSSTTTSSTTTTTTGTGSVSGTTTTSTTSSPTGGVQGLSTSSSTTSVTSGVQGIVTTPTTGAGDRNVSIVLGIALALSGVAVLGLTPRRRPAEVDVRGR